MFHNAYDSFQLLNNCPPRIDALESHGSKLFVGCYDGSLRIYFPQSSPSSSELRQEPYVLETTVSGFSKKPIVSIRVLASRELLLSLSESISFHKLPNLETVAVIAKAKGANAYSWDDGRGFLCFSRQKRVCVFKHGGGGGFVEVRDFGVPDTVKSISWRGGNICLVKEELYKHRKGVAQVTSESMCPLCNKRIGTSVFAVYPNGKTLVHFVCFKDYQGMKAVSKTSHGRRR